MPQNSELRSSEAAIARLRAALGEHAAVAIAELRRVEQVQLDLVRQLEIEKTRFVVAQELARVGSWEIDVLSGATVWSSEFYHILEAEPARLPASYAAFMSFVPPEDYVRVDEAYIRSLTLRSTQSVEHQLRMADGRKKYVDHRWRTLFDEKGRAIRSVGTCQDITHRREAETDLRASAMQLRRLVSRLNSVREDEARRLSRELHDDLGQQLSALAMELNDVASKLHPMEPEVELQFAEIHNLAQSLIGEVQKISGELRLGQLDHLGLAAAIEVQLAEFRRRSGLRCLITHLDDTEGLPDEVATASFRILQESLTNISRHAGATRVEVSLRRSDDGLTLEVRDDGRGITAEQAADLRACGLLGMKERAEGLDGRVTLHGLPGQGTVVRLDLPLPCAVGAAP